MIFAILERQIAKNLNCIYSIITIIYNEFDFFSKINYKIHKGSRSKDLLTHFLYMSLVPLHRHIHMIYQKKF